MLVPWDSPVLPPIIPTRLACTASWTPCPIGSLSRGRWNSSAPPDVPGRKLSVVLASLQKLRFLIIHPHTSLPWPVAWAVSKHFSCSPASAQSQGTFSSRYLQKVEHCRITVKDELTMAAKLQMALPHLCSRKASCMIIFHVYH